MKTSCISCCIADCVCDCSHTVCSAGGFFGLCHKNVRSCPFIDPQSSLLLDLSRAIFPSCLYFIHKCVSDFPEAAADLSQVPGDSAGLILDLPQRLRPHDPLRRVLSGYPGLRDGVGRDLGRPADRARLCQFLDDMQLVDEGE